MRHQRRQRHVIGLTYGTTADQISTYVERVRAVLSEDPEVADGPEVHLNGLGASSIDVLVHYHLVTDSWTRELELRGEHVLAFMRIAEEVGVSFAFPSTSVYVEQLPDSTP